MFIAILGMKTIPCRHRSRSDYQCKNLINDIRTTTVVEKKRRIFFLFEVMYVISFNLQKHTVSWWGGVVYFCQCIHGPRYRGESLKSGGGGWLRQMNSGSLTNALNTPSPLRHIKQASLRDCFLRAGHNSPPLQTAHDNCSSLLLQTLVLPSRSTVFLVWIILRSAVQLRYKEATNSKIRKCKTGCN